MALDADDYPRSLKSPAAQERRRAMLTLPHVAPLVRYTEHLRSRPGACVPEFDPCDGGIDARILFLFEKPGPKTDVARGGSGFISRNNNDPTAEAAHAFLIAAGIPRGDTVLWNLIPWWNDTRDLTREEHIDGRREVSNLVALLPRLHTIVLVGRTAKAARPYLDGFKIIESDHPSPLVRAKFFERWTAIPDVWRQATLV
jgi:hypothetical protein